MAVLTAVLDCERGMRGMLIMYECAGRAVPFAAWRSGA
jgi:hypothetical protein